MVGIPGRGPIIGGIGGGIMCIPPIGTGGIGAGVMCGEGVTLFCISLDADEWLLVLVCVGVGLVGSSVQTKFQQAVTTYKA